MAPGTWTRCFVVTPPPHTGSMTKQLVLLNGPPAPRSTFGRLDERTKQVGRRGVSEARAALAAASRRAAERDSERLERREQELARRAAAARAAAARRAGDTPEPTRTDRAA